MNKEKILNLLNDLNQSEKEKIYNLFDEIKNLLSESDTINFNEFDELKKMLSADTWPEAVMNFQICDEHSETEKMERAEGVIEILIIDSLKDKKFLDYGCGEGHMAKYASVQETKVSIGYDLQKINSCFDWEEKQNNFLLTTDKEKVKNYAPYDIILIYDVLDHADNPEQVLLDAKSLLSENGKIYLRCHPWCGRHGGHLYRQINKAFIHLIFTEAELEKLGISIDKSIKNKVIYPISTYEKYISNAGLDKISMEIDEQLPESFFSKSKLLADRIKLALPEKDGTKKRESFPEFQIKQSFLDFVLKK